MANEQVYVTLAALPLSFQWQWPVRPSEAGSDWSVIHGTARLEDGGPLKAELAVAITQTIQQAIGGLDPRHVEPLIINAVRKELDVQQLELLKTSKKQPVQVSRRIYDFKRNCLVFSVAGENEVREMLRRKVYWNARRREQPALIADPVEAVFLNTTGERIAKIARDLERAGEIALQAGYATATRALLAAGDEIEAAMRKGLEELEQKHAYEQLRA